MTINDVVDEIKLELTGGVLELEIDDVTLELVIKKALRELQRYWDESSFLTIPYDSCVDLTKYGLDKLSSSVVKVYRTDGLGAGGQGVNSATFDPLYAQQWMLFSNGGTMFNVQDYVLNYAAWTTLNQVRNTISTELSFTEDKHNQKLYINNCMTAPDAITVEFIPKLDSIDKIQSDYWQDILIKLSLALTKIALGRIRTRFTQSNALWTQDGDKLLDDGTTELKELREVLRTNSNLIYAID
jgi:hypothetical protein